jgi:hypothetical protein
LVPKTPKISSGPRPYTSGQSCWLLIQAKDLLSLSCTTCFLRAFRSSPPTAAATTWGLSCCSLIRNALKSRVFCGTIISSMIFAPWASASVRVAFEVLCPHT